MSWNNDEPSYYEESTYTLYVCMDCILSKQDCEITKPHLKIQKIIIGSRKESDLSMVQEEVNKADIPTIEEFETYNPPGTPRIYRITDASFRVTISPEKNVSYIPRPKHNHSLLLQQLKSNHESI